jgi:hypothetical protein
LSRAPQSAPASNDGTQTLVPPKATQRSPIGQGAIALQSCWVPMPHDVWQLVEATPPMPRVAQQALPVGQVPAVHPIEIPMHAVGAVHIAIPMPLQQTWGG